MLLIQYLVMSHSAFQFQRVSQSNYHLLSYLNKTKHCRKTFSRNKKNQNLKSKQRAEKASQQRRLYRFRFKDPLLYKGGKGGDHLPCLNHHCHPLWVLLLPTLAATINMANSIKINLKSPSERQNILNNLDNVKELKLILATQTTCLISFFPPTHRCYM